MRIRLLAAGALFATAPQLFSASLSPGFFEIDQLAYNNGAGSTSVGQIQVLSSGSLGFGFVNVLDSTGSNWLVQNLPVGLDVEGTTDVSRFLISSSGSTLAADDLYVNFSSNPLETIGDVLADDPSGPINGLNVVQMMLDIGTTGDDEPETGFEAPGGNVNFNGGRGFTVDYQTGHANVEAAVNQCAPAAVANSLTWLGVATTPNNPGTGANPNGSLVGMLDNFMGRNLTGCKGGPCGVWPLDGKLSYLQSIGQTGLEVNFQDTGTNGARAAGNGNALGAGDYTAHGITANNKGAPSFDFILSELQRGEDVEIDIRFPCTIQNPNPPPVNVNSTCRHYVEVTGGGYILGQAFITHVSDQLQGQAGGNNSIQFDWVTNGNGLPGWGNGAIIDQVISESTPEPGTLILLGAGLLAATRLRKRQRS